MTLAALYPSEIIGESFRLRKFTNVARSSPKQPSDNPVRVFVKRAHASGPHIRHERYGADMERSCPKAPRTIHDQLEIKREVADALGKDFGHLKSHLKVIAGKAEASPRTVEAWVDGTNLPGLEYFLRLVPHSPSLQSMLRRLMTLDPDSDPEAHRAFMDLVRTIRDAGR